MKNGHLCVPVIFLETLVVVVLGQNADSVVSSCYVVETDNLQEIKSKSSVVLTRTIYGSALLMIRTQY